MVAQVAGATPPHLLVRFNHVAIFIVNANHSAMVFISFALIRLSVISVAAYARETFSDKIGHSNCVILRESCKLANLRICC
jgi:hypothetical protein